MEEPAYTHHFRVKECTWQFQVYTYSGDNCDLLRLCIFLHVAAAARMHVMHVSICFAAARMHVKTCNHNTVDCINDTRATASTLLSKGR